MEISSQYDPKIVEEKALKIWLEKDIFSADANSNRRPFSIVIPPPNITGILHMGHALNNTIQDVLIRFKRMQGYESLWMPGTDHAGIATQNVVERDLAKEKLRKEDIGREKFLKRLWAWRDEYGSTIIHQLKRLGCSCDWRRLRFTMDERYCESVQDVFISLWKRGVIYQGNYIINWCPRCKTALSDEEAPYQEKEGFLYYIKYPIKESCEYVVVATTRPETMMGDVAVAVNPKDKRYKKIWDKKIILPVLEREITVIKDDFVDPEFGTGIVKVTPAHDPNDFQMGQNHNLEPIVVINPDGTMNDAAGIFSGMDRFEARQALIETLKERELIEKIEPYSHSVGHCYRCNTVIEPYLSRQWFVKMKPLAKPAIKAVKEGEIKFYPERWKKVYLNWMDNIRDWCISRQIWWGHRLPVFYCKNCIETGSRNEKLKIKNKKYTGEGIIVSKIKPNQCPNCGSQDLYQDEDVLDTWFSSWLWPFATFYWPFGSIPNTQYSIQKKELEYFYPTSVLVTAPEIIFFWVARMIMSGFEFMGRKPFSDVYIHGTVRDNTGRKMSKSLGNIIDPLEIIDKFGADSLRFSLMLLACGGADIYLSDDKFLVGRNFANKIWNAARFLLLKIKQENIKVENLEFSAPDTADKWILRELNRTIEAVTFNLDNYRFNDAAKKIYEFFWHSFCDWYLEIVKDAFNAGKVKVLIYVFINSLKLLHPFMCFITEEIFQKIKENTNLPLPDTIVTADWPKGYKLKKENKDKKIDIVLETIKAVRNIKIDLGLGTKKVNLEIKTSEENIDFLKQNQAWITRLSFSQTINFENKLKRVLYKNALWEINLGIEAIDSENIIDSLGKKIENLDKVFVKISQRLNNDKFLKNAAKETIEKEKMKFADVSVQKERLQQLKEALKKGQK